MRGGGSRKSYRSCDRRSCSTGRRRRCLRDRRGVRKARRPFSERAGGMTAAPPAMRKRRSTQRGALEHVDRIGFYERQHCLVLDAVTVRNLELIEPLFAGIDAGITLFRSIDATITQMCKRLLRAWTLRPSIDQAEIEGRLD